jgi:serine/threonine protein kinase
MVCGLHLPYSHHHDWLRDDTDTLSIMSTVRLPPNINPAATFPHQHTKIKKIGDGSEGFVETWSHKPTGFVMAVKVIKPRKKPPPEVDILKSLPAHPSIVHCFAYLPKQATPRGDCIFFEYCHEGDLFDLCRKLYEEKQCPFSEAFMWALFSQLASAIAFLHEGVGCANRMETDFWRPVVHRDIKIENILISTLGTKEDCSSLLIKVADFGLSAFYDPFDAKMQGNWGTTVLWPPEQTWEGREATPAGDVWAVGCVIHELSHGFPPVVDPELTERLAKKQKEVLKLPKNWGANLRTSFWESKTPRKPLPINLNEDQHEWDFRRKRPTLRYSDTLNECMMMALTMAVANRATAGTLKRHIEEAHAAFLFEELRLENKAMVEDIDIDESNEEWDM